MKKNMLAFLLVSIFANIAPVFAATNYFVTANSRTGEDIIEPYAAMCTTHALNVGNDLKNPADAVSREEMNRIIALKAEILTREMKKQYDYLDATVKRFQIQLQKAILVAQNEAAGAASSSSGGTTVQSEYQSCNYKGTEETVRCVRSNMAKYESSLNENKIPSNMAKSVDSDARAVGAACGTVSSSKTSITNCMNLINTAVRTMEDGMKKSSGGGLRLVSD